MRESRCLYYVKLLHRQVKEGLVTSYSFLLRCYLVLPEKVEAMQAQMKLV